MGKGRPRPGEMPYGVCHVRRMGTANPRIAAHLLQIHAIARAHWEFPSEPAAPEKGFKWPGLYLAHWAQMGGPRGRLWRSPPPGRRARNHAAESRWAIGARTPLQAAG